MGFVSPTLARGRVARVISVGVLDVILNLGWGVSVERRIAIEGVDRSMVPPRMDAAAMHACVILLGGKRIVVQEGPVSRDGLAIGRVYLDESLYRDPPGWREPEWYGTPVLDVTTFLTAMREQDFDRNEVLKYLNRRAP